MQKTIRLTLAALCLPSLLACATLPPGSKRDPHDPWERMNRATYTFNDKFDKAIARPVASGYRTGTPQFVQTGIRNAFDNVDTTIVIVNDLLQGQVKPFFTDTGRFLINTVMGIGGLFDVAGNMGIEKNDRDFGQTLGKWGVKPGPYLVLPFLGPCDVRDTFGKVADTYSTPRTYISNTYWNYGSWLVEKVDARSRLLDADHLIDEAYDPYAFLRNAYLQHRAFRVSGGQSASEQEQEEKLLEEAGGDNQAAPPAGAPKAQSPPAAQPQAAPQQPPPPQQIPH